MYKNYFFLGISEYQSGNLKCQGISSFFSSLFFKKILGISCILVINDL